MKKNKKIVALGMTLAISAMLVACNEEEKKEIIETKAAEEVVTEEKETEVNVAKEENEEKEVESEKQKNEESELGKEKNEESELGKEKNEESELGKEKNEEKKLEKAEEEKATQKKEANDELGIQINETAANSVASYLSLDGLNNVMLQVTMNDNHFSSMNESITLGYYRDYEKNNELGYFEYTMGGLTSLYKEDTYKDTNTGKEKQKLTKEEVEKLFKENVKESLIYIEEDGKNYKKILEQNSYKTYYDNENFKYDTEVIFDAKQLDQNFPTAFEGKMNIVHGETGDGAIVEYIAITVKNDKKEEVYSLTYDLSKKYKEIHVR